MNKLYIIINLSNINISTMKTSLNLTKHSINKKAFTTAVVPSFAKKDLTKKWLNRVQAKAKDQMSQESFAKLSSLVDYYTKSPQQYDENIDWDYWRTNLRSEGLVDKIMGKYNEFKSFDYNIDHLAAKSAVNSPHYQKYGMLLRYNHDLWMNQYMENLNALHGAMELGDIRYISEHEMFMYNPGIRERVAGWRETGYVIRSNINKIISNYLIIRLAVS
jgi:hypothetical protein